MLPYIFPNVVETVLLVSLDMLCRRILKITKAVGMNFHSVCGGHVEGGTSTIGTIDEMIGLCTVSVYLFIRKHYLPNETCPTKRVVHPGCF